MHSALLLLLALALGACTVPPGKKNEEVTVPIMSNEVALRMALVREIKEYEARVGWSSTDNFREYSDALVSYTSCTIASRLSFGTFLDPRLTKDECVEAGALNDTKFFEHEALAGKGTPLSRSLVHAKLTRFIYVVFHEDFHEQIRRIPTLALNESATQLVGFLAAREFTREKYGESSEEYRAFARIVEDFLANAYIQQRYHQALERIYADVRDGERDSVSGLAQKALLYDQMHNECKGVDLVFLASCKHITNNAFFISSMLYVAHYPLFFRLNTVCADDVKKTGGVIRRVVGENLTEEQFVARIEELIQKGCTVRGAP